jgi:hypothetical protein
MFETIAASGMRIVIISSNAETTVRNTLGPGISALVADYACGASLFGKARRLESILRRERIAPSELIYIGDEKGTPKQPGNRTPLPLASSTFCAALVRIKPLAISPTSSIACNRGTQQPRTNSSLWFIKS